VLKKPPMDPNGCSYYSLYFCYAFRVRAETFFQFIGKLNRSITFYKINNSGAKDGTSNASSNIVAIDLLGNITVRFTDSVPRRTFTVASYF
jgi:hypothetical protein